VLFQFDFYAVDPGGERRGNERITADVETIETAIAHAKSMMRDTTFTFGKANRCLVTDQDRTVSCEIDDRAPT
jgi:hypothetical protein